MDNNELQHNQKDEQLQRDQNALIDRNTRITVILGVIGILVGLLQVIAQIIWSK